MRTLIIKSILWVICFICLYIILTTYDIQTFGVIGFIGFISTWILVRWNKYEEKVIKKFEDVDESIPHKEVKKKIIIEKSDSAIETDTYLKDFMNNNKVK